MTDAPSTRRPPPGPGTGDAAGTGGRAAGGTTGPVWWLVLAVVAVRAGAMVGLWPLAVGAPGVNRTNLLALVVHAAGAIATLAFLLARSRAGVLIGLAYTGYSTIALGLNNPSPPLAAMVWVLGGLTLAALVFALIRSGLGRPARPSGRDVLVAVLPLVVSVAVVSATTIALFWR